VKESSLRALAVAIALVGGLSATSSTAFAEDKDSDAERLFREAQKLMEERRFGEACPKFEAAYTKDRALGTLINLAFCHKEQGATWVAWLEFREAEVKATEMNRADRRDFAKQRLAELEKLLPKVIIDNPQKVPLTDVLVEDRKVWEAERGAVFAAESGQRKFTFRAKGKKPATALINVVKGDKPQHVAVPDMEDGVEASLPGERAAEPGEKKPEQPAPARDSDPGSLQRTMGWVALGVGGVAAVVGTITGLSTLSSPCGEKPTPMECTDEKRDSALTNGTISDVSFVVAVLGVGGGLFLLFTAPTAPSTAAPAAATSRRPAVEITPRLGAGWAGLSGTF
jgi:hypothetical protein